MKIKSVFLGAALAAVVTTGAWASTTLTENFNEVPFGLWQSGWFGTESNAKNYYVSYEGISINNRGNNPDGLWISDGYGKNQPVAIYFNAPFAATLTSFSLDIAAHQTSTLTIFDKNGVTLLSTFVSRTFGAFSNPGVYAFYSTTSANGIGGFSLSGAAQGQISIDNVSVTVASNAPEPATWAMMLAGFAGLGFAGYRRKKAATLAA